MLFCLILLVGSFARIWEFGALPPGLNQDEASSGVDAFSLLHYGVDRNGIRFPVHAIAFGSGQNVPYDYLMIPFIALGGLNPITVRLPMLLIGIITLPLIFYVGRKTAGDSFGLMAMFFIAISPWHIMLSRWGLDSNILPFLFLCGYACLLASETNNHWFIVACLFFGFSLYAYGTAYIAVPIMVVSACLILFTAKRVNRKTLLIGLMVLLCVGTPIGLYVLINSFKLRSLRLGLITIPRLPSEPRYEMMGALFQPDFWQALLHNSIAMLTLFWTQSDHLSWNGLDPHGYFYRYTLPLAVIGAFGLLPLRKGWFKVEKLLLVIWLAACLPIGVLEEININRINLIFIPLIICMAYPLTWLTGRFKPLRWLLIAALLVGFAAFNRDYHGQAYRQESSRDFFAGLLPAIEAARQAGSGPICVTNVEVAMPYIYALFVEQTAPANYLNNIEYVDASAPFRRVRSLGRYAFGLENCAQDPKTIYILKNEVPPNSQIYYQVEQFGLFKVYQP